MSGPSREFLLEASNVIERLSDGFVDLRRDGFDRGTLDELFRDAHTLKGNCATEGLTAPRKTAHALEDLLDGVRGSPEAFDAEHVDVALEALDAIERQLTELQTGGSVETDAEAIVANVRALVPDAARDAPESDDDGLDGEVAIDDIEIPAGDEDVTVEEALENASVFDDLEQLESSVDADEFDDVDGVGLFAGDDDVEAVDPIEQTDPTGVEEAPDAPDDGVTSSTRRQPGTVPGEDDYATVVADTDRADPETLQSELEDVSFGEFDDDDELSIGDLVDRAESVAGDETTAESDPDRQTESDDRGGFDFGESGGDTASATADTASTTNGEVAEADDSADPTPATGGSSGVGDDTIDGSESLGSVEAEAEPEVEDRRANAEDAPTGDDVATPSTPSVGDIVDRIERMGDEEEDAASAAPADEVSGSRSTSLGDDRVTADDGDETGADDGVGAVFDAVSDATPSDQHEDVLPSDVPDVDELLDETGFEGPDDAAVAAADLYDRVGFETDSATGEFVDEFGDAFGNDAGDADRRRLPGDAATTIDPSLLDEAPDAEDGDTVLATDAVTEISLDVTEADRLLELTEELATNTQRLAGAVEDLPPAAADALSSVRDVAARIENQVAGVRLVPLENALSGLGRTARRASRSEDKQVTFLTENESVEVDRRVVDEIADPLAHLVRNAVAHGIEHPDERVAKGKPPEGTVLVRAERDGQTVSIAVEDDGRGVNPDDLREAAVEDGRYDRAAAAALSRSEALDLMFEPGVSTTEEVSEVSGRGVGMDVVADTVSRLEGTVEVSSEPDVGTTVELTLPVSVSLSDVLVVSVGDRRFALPAPAVRRVEELVPGRVDGDEYRVLRGEGVERVPLVDLATALDVGGGADGDSDVAAALSDVVVLVDAPEPLALRAGDVVDWESVVVQPFDGVLRNVGTVRGAGLIGDGSPVVVLEPGELEGDS